MADSPAAAASKKAAGNGDGDGDLLLFQQQQSAEDEEEEFDQLALSPTHTATASQFEYDDSIPALSLPQTRHRHETELDKSVGFWDGMALIVGGIIGSGIFASPGPVLLDAGSIGASLLVWILAGILAITGGLSYAELGTMIPESGGDYPYLLRAWGSLPAFLFSWTNILASRPGSIAIIITICSQYTYRLFSPAASPADMTENALTVKLIGVTFAILLTFINCQSNLASTSVQGIMTISKLLAVIIIGLTGLIFLSQGAISQSFAQPLFQGTSLNLGSYSLALYSALWSYDGWNALNVVAGELADPEKNLPRAIIGGTSLVMLVYFTTNMAYYIVLPREIISTSSAIALDFGRVSYGSFGRIIIPVFVILSTLGAANGSMFGGARITFVASQQGHAPSFLGQIHSAKRTPFNALLLQGFLSILFIMLGEFKSLINIYSIIIWVWYLTTVLGLLYLRYTEPFANRPFKVFIGVPIFFCVMAVSLLCFSIVEAASDAAWAFLFLASGIPSYYLGNYISLDDLFSKFHQAGYSEIELQAIGS